MRKKNLFIGNKPKPIFTNEKCSGAPSNQKRFIYMLNRFIALSKRFALYKPDKTDENPLKFYIEAFKSFLALRHLFVGP